MSRVRDRVASTLMSVLLHLALIGALAYGWWTWHEHSQQSVPALAINATVVDSRALGGRAAPPAPPPPPPAAPAPTPPPVAEDQTVAPPPPDPQEAVRKAAAQDAERKQEEQQAQREEAQREEAERAAAQRKEQERKAREAEELKQQRLAEAKREAEQKRKQQEAAQLAQSQAELQQGIAEDEKALAARTGPEMVSYRGLIQARIQSNWIRPPTAREGLDCTLDVTQVPGGQVVNVKLEACNGDAAVRQSIENAVYRASPLPDPPDPALFQRNFAFRFKPDQ
jgi:colicin import membrane protein